MTRDIAWYGWRKDSLDSRDRKYTAPARIVTAPLPTAVDLTNKCPPVFNQGALGSCTANAIGSAFQFEQRRQQVEEFAPSRLFIYYNEREMEGTVDVDSGAEIRTGIKSVAKQGVCSEVMWPYNIDRYKTRPHASCYDEASTHQALVYMRVTQTLDQLKCCLAEGYPIVFGFMVYASFESSYTSGTGRMKMPLPNEAIVGGHAVMAIGYDDTERAFIVRNSWGEDWGIGGNFWMPYDYIADPNLASDFWTIRVVEAGTDPVVPTPTPLPESHSLCPGFLRAAGAFVDGALGIGVHGVSSSSMIRAGLLGLQTHIRAMEKLEGNKNA